MLLLDANLHNEGKKRMTAAAAHFLFFTFLDEVKFSKATLCTTWQLSEKIVHPRFFYQELAWQHAKLCNIIGKSEIFANGANLYANYSIGEAKIVGFCIDLFY